jgi:hypothetical protein
MKKVLLFLVAILAANFAQANNTTVERDSSWKRTAGIGLDLGQLAMINPRIGSGENRINIGGAATFALNYKKNHIAWDNNLGAIFGVQKLGTGVSKSLITGSNQSKPFQKSADELRASSKIGYSLKKDSKWFIAADFSALSQLTATYDNSFLSDRSGKGALAEFLSPAIFTAALGIDYKPTSKISIFYAPLSWRGVMVKNTVIGARSIGTTTVGESFGLAKGATLNSTAGSLLRAIYTDKFWDKKLVFNSNLALFGGYKAGSGIKMDWANQIGWNIYKGLQLSLGANAFYDKEIKVQVTDNNAPNGIKLDSNQKAILESRVSLIEQLLLKYSTTF